MATKFVSFAFAVCGLSSFALVGCDRMLTRPSLYNSVTVVAQRRNGDPVPGVSLELYTGQRPMGYGTTPADGRFTFMRVPQGLYGVSAVAPSGYEVQLKAANGASSGYIQNLNVANDTLSPVQFTFLKEGPGSVAVTVQQPGGSLIAGAPVTLYSPSATIAKATTDASGHATFNNVPFGVYGIAVTRPILYRDFNSSGDSLYAFRDNIVVDEGSQEVVTVPITRCAGSIRAVVQDQNGAPVPLSFAMVYSTSGQLNTGATGVDGSVIFGSLPCATQLGVEINPPAGYSVTETRGSRFVDGLKVTNAAVDSVTLRVTKQP